MNASELREKSVSELQERLHDLRKDQFSYRMQKTTGQLGQLHLIKDVKTEIARVKTLITEKQRSGS
jgi:large subunit ribosomal protein L29